MRSWAYYNEIDSYAAQWLRNLIRAGHIAPGEVDERSIEDVHPEDVRGFTQCHWFAGIGVWSSALRLAGWADDRPVWTGSCPCQPFSAAGKGLGFDDERHLWPAWHHLISECRPATIFGEQVASKDVDSWIDLVFDDLEAMEYACAANPFPSAGVGAPHIRDRTFFLADAHNARSQGWRGVRQRLDQLTARARRVAGRLADDNRDGFAAKAVAAFHDTERDAQPRSSTCRLADANVSTGRQGRAVDAGGNHRGNALERARLGSDGSSDDRERIHSAGPTNGFWRAADWVLCRDEKWRPVEPGTQPLAHGLAAGMGKLSAEQHRLASVAGLDGASLKRAKAYRVGTLRGFGNAINRIAAAEFIAAADEAMTTTHED